MPPDDPKIRAAIDAQARALEVCILAKRMQSAGYTGAHRALVDGAQARRLVRAPRLRDLRRIDG